MRYSDIAIITTIASFCISYMFLYSMRPWFVVDEYEGEDEKMIVEVSQPRLLLSSLIAGIACGIIAFALKVGSSYVKYKKLAMHFGLS
jgi:hypothetical protein